MKTKILVGALVFLIVINLATLGTYLFLQFTAPPDDIPSFAGGPPGAMLELDASTRERLRVLMQEFRREAMPIQQRIRNSEDSLARMLQQDPVPLDLVDSLFSRIAELRTAVGQRAVRRLVETKSFLSPEQQQIFFRSVLDQQPRMRPGGGMRQGARFGPGQRGEPPFEHFPPTDRDSQP